MEHSNVMWTKEMQCNAMQCNAIQCLSIAKASTKAMWTPKSKWTPKLKVMWTLKLNQSQPNILFTWFKSSLYLS